ncbi:preprotein translocase subunit YajC [Fulvivirga sediminis]|uniref:Sec translocon accessory complex subunit YajC n=1 Tax=Fulvivirga sediminis TaxID=2803949 RepID=A0A937JZM8_9BACT|nr:preprotein translocase subunit YajC [Fulvivirga sediminis]MBL3654582.1 preprotein translocase subunit YajC [Fulvivirga sediminis]
MLKTVLLQAGADGGGGYGSLILFGGVALVFYFFMIRPQQKKQKQQKKFIEEIKRGDFVVTIGGIHGKVLSSDETTVVLEVDKGVKMTFLKSAISLDSTVPSDADKKEVKKEDKS